MKRFLFILAVFILVTVNSFGQTVYDFFKLSVGNLLEFSKNLTQSNNNYEFYTRGNALWGVHIPAGSSITITFPLDEGVQYVSMAATDSKLVNLDVYEGSKAEGRLIARDGFHLAAAIVRFRPSKSGLYTFELANPADKPALISLLTLQARRNPNFTMKPLVEAIENGEALFRRSAGRNPGLAPNTVNLFGGNLVRPDSAETEIFTGFTAPYPEGDYVLLASGDNSVTAVTPLVLEKGSAGASEKSDRQYTRFTSASSKTYDFRVYNRASRNENAFVLGFIVQP